MPRTRSLAWSELKVGILTIIGIVIAAATIILLTGGRGFPWQRYSLKVRFASVPGLKSGSPVRLAGVEVGSVSSVELSGEQVDIVLKVNRSRRDLIRSASVARLGSVSMLGEAAVDITRRRPVRRFRNGATCRPAGRPRSWARSPTRPAREYRNCRA